MKRALALLLFTAALSFAQEQGAQGAEAGDSLAIWRLVNFAILAIGLGYLMAKYLPAFFRERTESIQADIAQAQKQKEESARRVAEIDRRLAGLGTEIEAFRKQSHAEMGREGERIRQETATQIRKIKDQAQVEIESAGKAARREVRLYAANLALDLADQRIRARLSGPGGATTEAALVDGFIGDLRREESRN